MKQLKRIFSCALAFTLVLSLLFSMTSCKKNKGNNTVYMAVEGYGIVTIELYEKQAPITVGNFKKLVSEGFYDGLTFHRIIQSFVIQGGDPLGNGMGGSDEDIVGEFKANGYDTGLKHVEGTLSMARSGSQYEAYYYAGYDVPMEYLEPAFNSASSQFFIVTETSANNSSALDGKYAAFGQVTDGMEIVKAIAAVKTDSNDKPVTPVKIAVVTFDLETAQAALN